VKRSVLLVILTLLPAVGTAAAQGFTVRPGDRAWEKFGLAERVQVLGDLVDPDCPSVTLLRLRPDTRLPPHSAQVDRTYLLLSGTVRVGIGKKWDPTRMRTLPAGSFWVVPANTSTFEWFEDEAVCQVVAISPVRDCTRPEEVTVYTPDQVPWQQSGGPGRAVLAGDPASPGCPYVERLRLPASAPATPAPAPPPREVVWTVLTGTLHPTSGAAVKPVLSGELPAGTVIVVPAGTDLAGSGPTGTVAQRQFAGAGPRACKWREPRR
jgi:quercetin dioxygenase-like cupin family protein